ncbi:transporter [Bacillus cereus]|uniref:Transporter n=1 Tax=Bacillus cereus TaxID=1396 RepID=A0A2B2MD82_BACCE|nr:transporter [Bacillus cereus]PFQ53793.1 transporter [Bacillus cereus]
MHFGPAAALPSVLAAVWHNIAGPILATVLSKIQRKNLSINIEKKEISISFEIEE